MSKKSIARIILVLLSTSVLTTAFDFQYARASMQKSNYAPAISITYHFSKPQIEESCLSDEGPSGYISVNMGDLPHHGNTGLPVLPFKTAKILLPFGTKFEGVRAIGGKKTRLSGSYLVECGQRPTPLSVIESADAPVKDLPDKAVYGSSKPFPNKLYSDVSVQNKMGYKILLINLHPVEYIPKTGDLFYYESIDLDVEVTPTGVGATSDFNGYSQQREIVETMVDNPGTIGTYPASMQNSNCTYVIITNEYLNSTPGPNNFQALINDKISRGINATIVTTEWIYANYNGTRPDGGEDNQTKIRNFITDACNNWGTKYVLLGGDGDGADVGGESGDTIIPHRGFYGQVGIDKNYLDYDIPADMYYGCLDGDFDFNSNGIYGEPSDGQDGGEVDLLAEVYVGRACVDSQEEVQNFVRKTLDYQNTPADFTNLQKAWMVGEYLGFGGVADWGGNYKDEIKEGSSAHGYTTLGFENCGYAFNVSTLYDRDYPANDWPKSEIVDIINTDVHLINHLGHAFVNYVMKMNNLDVDSLSNEQLYFIGYSQGCYSGSFDNRHLSSGNYTTYDCISEHLTTTAHGAVAFISNSRYGWGLRGSTDGPSQHYDRQFWDAVLGEEKFNIGIANQDSKEDNVGYVNDMVERWCYFEINLFGDPELRIKIPRYEHDLKLSLGAPTYVESGDASLLNATVYNNGLNNEANVELCLYIDDNVVNSVTIPELLTDSSYTISYLWNPTDKEIYNVTAYAVPVPNEVWTENNVESKYAFVGMKTICVPEDFETIQEAVDAVGPGFTILVRNGTYSESVVVDKAVTLVGENKGNTTINANEAEYAIVAYANNVNITNLTLMNGSYGVGLVAVQDCEISNCYIANNSFGIWLNSANYNSISGNDITENNEGGIMLYYSNYNSISGNDITENNGGGISTYTHCSNNIISGNNIKNNWSGIKLFVSCNHNTVSGNNITGNSNGYGIMLVWCSNNKLRSNIMADNGYNFGVNGHMLSDQFPMIGHPLSDFIHDVDVSNTVDGKPVYYLINQANLVISPSTCPNIGYLALVNSTNITVEGLELKNNYQGILLAYSNHTSIRQNNITNNSRGIYLYASSNNSIIENNVIANNNSIYLMESSNNKFYHNNFIDNTYQVYTYPAPVNVWDDGYPSGGNYWSDYAGKDDDGDRIGDTPYIIYTDNQDNYPLMIPYPWVYIQLLAKDQFNNDLTTGDVYIDDELAGYTNSTFILSKDITSEVYLNDFWEANNTGNRYFFNHWGEDGSTENPRNLTVTADTTITAIFNKIYCPGDVNGDGKVDVRDIGLCTKIYGSHRGDSNWDSRCDLNCDGKVDMTDVNIVSANYGKTYW